jgi:cell division transport system permease protein
MNPRLVPYFVKQAVKNMLKNRLVHLIGMTTMVISLLILGAFLLLFININSLIQGWGQTLSLSIYLEDGIDEREREEIVAFLEKLPSAEIERFISKEAALAEFRAALGSQAGLLDGLSDNPLPASFEVVFQDVGFRQMDPKSIKMQLQALAGVEEVQYSEEWMRRFEGLMRMVRLVGFVIGGLLCLGVLFIITNTIKLTIYSRREEIDILELVGATDWFVKIPFLLEGMIQGVLSGASALLILFLGYLAFSAKQTQLLGLGVLHFKFLPQEYALAIFSLSVMLGLVGSFIAVGRFIKV